ncbi:hypothetical protein [Nitratireductor basaltis]|uniref:Alkaline proteinase inhibitor/ Outer membrane lipoprotein Omp19 domain-containing protein n=1 Tax=Nitratireductor basaltis TaxID=472175 RepID=A0A084U7Z3_9HYPH|nr:hypothetical protein [Nitratireductor basaltis]KFB09079.1 hypothetical protein EL18_00093 [Nitratireductor basaltis]
MKLLVTGLLLAGLVGAAPLVLSAAEDDGAAAIVAAKSEVAQFRLSVAGHDETCTISSGKPTDVDNAVLVNGDCSSAVPALRKVRYWRKDGTGDLVLAADSGEVVAKFFAADGVAYESLKPVSPMMVLTAEN